MAGARGEYSDDYGFFFAPKVSGMFYLSDKLRVLPAVGLGYRAPSFLELYLDSAGNVYHKYGNPDLVPEKSLGFNLGVEWLSRTLTVQANAFHNELWDEIAYDYTDQYEGSLQVIVKENLARSFRSGCDVSAELPLGKLFAARARYGFLYGYDRGADSRLRDQPVPHGRRTVEPPRRGQGVKAYAEVKLPGPLRTQGKLAGHHQPLSGQNRRPLHELFLGVDNLTGETDEYSTYLAGPVIYVGINTGFHKKSTAAL